MKTLYNSFIMGLVILFVSVTFLQLSRGYISEAVGAAMITGFIITFIRRGDG